MAIKRESNKAFKKVKSDKGEFYAPKKYDELNTAQKEGVAWANKITKDKINETLGLKKKS